MAVAAVHESLPGRFCCKSILELGRARARSTRFLPKPLSRMGIPARPLSAEHDSISRPVYQTSERLLQQNRHSTAALTTTAPVVESTTGAVAATVGSGG